MRNVLIILALFGAMSLSGQNQLKTPGLMLGLDSTLVIREYSQFNNLSIDESWQKISKPGQIIFYCQSSSNKNKENVAHIYDFDNNGVNYKYTTISTQEKIKYAVDYFNNLSVNRKHLYKYEGVISDNQAIWTSNDKIAELAGCNCGNVKVTVFSNLAKNSDLVENSYVRPGKSGELMAIVYTPNK